MSISVQVIIEDQKAKIASVEYGGVVIYGEKQIIPEAETKVFVYDDVVLNFQRRNEDEGTHQVCRTRHMENRSVPGQRGRRKEEAEVAHL